MKVVGTPFLARALREKWDSRQSLPRRLRYTRNRTRNGRDRTLLSMLRYFKPVIFLACLAPLGILVWRGFHSALGANPIEAITHATGDWTLRFLLGTLSVTPLRRSRASTG